MDAIFAILVLGAVIFFGALISAGNERQRKAIDGIREQAAQWAMQDLRLKREHLARDVKVDDPVAWLNRVVAKAVGEDLGLTVTEIFDEPQLLVCTAKDGQKVVLSKTSPFTLQKRLHGKNSKLSLIGNANPLLTLTKHAHLEEVTVLTEGIMFEVELKIAWESLTKQKLQDIDRLFVIFP